MNAETKIDQTFLADVVVTPSGKHVHDRPFFAVSQNISLGGTFLQTELQLPENTNVTLDIVPQQGRPIRVRGRVVNVRPSKGFGCIFTRVSGISGVHLKRWLGRCGGIPAVAGEIQCAA